MNCQLRRFLEGMLKSNNRHGLPTIATQAPIQPGTCPQPSFAERFLHL